MIELRQLAAIDIALLGYRFILAEFAFGILFSLALGLFVLARSHSHWQAMLGIYLLCLGINYLPMLNWTIAIGNQENARAELGDELAGKRDAMAKYRRQSLLLLIPLLPLALVVAGKVRRAAG